MHFEIKPSQDPMLADENFIMYLILYITIIDRFDTGYTVILCVLYIKVSRVHFRFLSNIFSQVRIL